MTTDHILEPYRPDSLNNIIESAIRKYWNLTALSDLGGVSYSFSELAESIEKIHLMFEAAGLKPGDKVAICGKNSSDWAVAFVACITSGMTAVPLLHEFKPANILNIINHSESRFIFADSKIYSELDLTRTPNLEGVYVLGEKTLPFSRNKSLSECYDSINEIFGKKYPHSFTPADVNYYRDTPEEICLINYTSGSTGASKGVMLPFRSIWSNIVYCIEHLTFLKPGDGMVNMLPLGHLYGMVIEMLHPLVKGCHCHFITKAPSPAVILKAFAEVRPKLIITVPLVLEKIIRSKVFPKLNRPLMKFMLAIPFVRQRILAKVRTALLDVFGGEVKELIIGGAPLNADVEKLLDEIKFPITVGYGMTECGPLLTYAPPSETRPHTVGRIVDRMEVKIDSPDPEHIPGNILVKGTNLMKGYFKNQDATEEAFADKDGWMNTGDMGTISSDGLISISGRSKTMILGPSGQNIYPEEIEQVINNMPLVNESLVIDDGGKLVALIHPDYEAAAKENLTRSAANDRIVNLLKPINSKLEGYNRIKEIRIMEEEFEKTPKRSIKRFLYS